MSLNQLFKKLDEKLSPNVVKLDAGLKKAVTEHGAQIQKDVISGVKRLATVADNMEVSIVKLLIGIVLAAFPIIALIALIIDAALPMMGFISLMIFLVMELIAGGLIFVSIKNQNASSKAKKLAKQPLPRNTK